VSESGDWEVVLVDVAVEAASGLRVGGAGGNLGTDAPVLRDRRGPLIPGSSLKGVLRSAAERLLRARAAPVGAASVRAACDIIADPCATGQKADQPVDINRLCRVCRLFGNHWLGARLTVGDLVVTPVMAGQPSRAVTVIRDGVAIDRNELKAAGRLKYDYEVVVPGTRFAGQLRVDDPDKGDLGLLLGLLDLLDLGVITVGGGASRGLGRLRLTQPPTARRLRASTWKPGAQPEPMDLDHERQALTAILQEVGG
jgi:CRISPR-associated RAMP protein (TIGR02581 family)